MKNNLNISILVIVIIIFLVIGTVMSNMIAHFSFCRICIDRISHVLKVKNNDKNALKMMVPVINKSNNETAEDLKCLSVTNVIQLVLENTIKSNNDIALMAIYSEDGTILAHLKPERIGKNMFDADVELKYCMKDMYKAIKSRRIYNGYKYDPLLNEHIRFIVKPLQISNLENKLSLLIGVR